jgi:hypothetical protein
MLAEAHLCGRNWWFTVCPPRHIVCQGAIM